MATDTDSAAADAGVRRDAIESFGQVSRTVGTVFRYVLLAATLVGIVALGILLVYVSLDAFQPFTADAGWLLTMLATPVAPTLATGAYLYWRTERGLTVGLTTLGVAAIGLLFGSGMSVLFISILPPVVWLQYTLAVALPFAALVAVEWARGLPFLAKVGGTLAALAASLAVVPGLVGRAPVLPADWIILVATLGLPTAAVVGWFARDRWDRRTAGVAAAATLAAAVAGALAGPALGIGAIPGVILSLCALVPLGLYVGVVVSRDPGTDVGLAGTGTVGAAVGSRAAGGPVGADEGGSSAEAAIASAGGTGTVRDVGVARDRLGLALPAVLVVGTTAGLLVVDLLGFAGPASNVNWALLTSTTVTSPDTAGVYPGIVGSLLLMIIVALVSFPVGVGAAVYLEEYAPDNRFTHLVQVNISNLAGVPSVVYGLLGLGLFIRYLGSPPGTVIVGGLTLALLILPIVVISAQEAVRSVPDSLRQASYGMGATRWQTIRNVVLPRAFPGILTGTILALGRAIGETAPLLVIGAPNVFDVPQALTARVGALPLQIFAWATTFAGDEFYTDVIPAAVVVLLVIMLTMNSLAIVLRNRYQREA